MIATTSYNLVEAPVFSSNIDIIIGHPPAKVYNVLAAHDIMVEQLHVDGGEKGSQYVNCLCLYAALVMCISISHQKVYGSLAIHILGHLNFSNKT